MKRIFGSIAILLIPGALMAQGKGNTHATAPRPNMPATASGTMANERHEMNPPAVNKGDERRSERGEARAKDVAARADAREDRNGRTDMDSRPAHKRKHHHKRKGNRRP